MRVFGKEKFYVKDAITVEKLAKINHIVFDKTGTLTINKASKISYTGNELTTKELENLKALLQNSNHPLSRSLYEYISMSFEFIPVKLYEEIPGKGIKGNVNGMFFKIGSSDFVGAKKKISSDTSVHISINDIYKGHYIFKNQYRKDLKETINALNNYKISLLSGDNDSEKYRLEKIFSPETILKFNQSPQDKLDYIRELQEKGYHVMMLGDGLNDAGALRQSNVGIAISDDINSFTPSSDAILDGNNFSYLPSYLKLSKKALGIVSLCFVISFCYNIIGLSFAVSNKLSPLVAAILMPLSSISVVTFTTLVSRIIGYKMFIHK